MPIINSKRLTLAAAGVLFTLMIVCSMAAAEHDVTQEVQQQLNRLDQAADAMYESARNKAWDETREHIGQLKDRIPQIQYEGITDIEGMNALTEAALSAEYSLNQVKLSGEEVIIEAARLRLAVDALAHPHQPMWLQHYKWFQEGAEQMEAALEINNPAKFEESIHQVLKHYHIVRPSILINRERELVVKMDSILKYLQQAPQNASYNRKQLENVVSEYKNTIKEIFERNSQDAYTDFSLNPVPPGGLIIFSSFILAVLAVAGWRIYQYERKAGFVPVKRKTRDF